MLRKIGPLEHSGQVDQQKMQAISELGLSTLAATGRERSGFVAHCAEVSLAWLVFACLTLPVVTISSSLPWLRPEQVALIPVLFTYTWLLLAGRARPIRANGLMLVGLIYAICLAVSILYGTVVLEHEFLVRDLYEIPKALLPVVFFTLGLEIELTEGAIRRILNYFSLAMVLVCAYGWAQWMNLGIASRLAPFYSGGEHVEGSLSHYRRVYSTMGNPNVLGQLLTWAIVGFTLAALFMVGNRVRNLLLAFACLVTLAMTGSRYGLLNTALGLGLILVLPMTREKRRFAMIALGVILIPIFAATAVTVAQHNQATMARFQTLRNPLQADSLRDRLDNLWRDAGDQIAQSPFFGHGPSKAIFSDVFTDSEYLDELKEVGVVGFIVYLVYYLYPLRQLWRGLRVGCDYAVDLEAEFPAAFWLLRLSIIMAITALVMNVGMSTFRNQPLQGFLWLWMGMGAGLARWVLAAQGLTPDRFGELELSEEPQEQRAPH